MTDEYPLDPMIRACLAGGIVLRRPDRGPGVRWLQQALVDLGYDLPAHGVDGIFGPETAAAVVAFKVDNGIEPPDPVVGVHAAQVLAELLSY